MQILINKSGRIVKLTKRERDLLSNAKALLAELAVSGGGDISNDADVGASAIGNVQEHLTPTAEIPA